MQNQQLSSFIARNISSFTFPEDVPEPTSESRRCHFFRRGMLLFYPRLECPTCNMTYLNEFDFPKDQEINTVECPGCKEQHTPKLTVQGFNTKAYQGQRRVMTRSAEQHTDAELEDLYTGCEATDFTETVDWLGIEQLQFRLAKLLLSQPLLLMTSIELVKKQPTLAYNMRFTLENFEDTLIAIVFELLKQAKIEGFRNSGLKQSVGEILPVKACLPDEKQPVAAVQDMVMNPEEKQVPYDKLTTYVFVDRRKGEHVISLRTFHGNQLVKDGKLLNIVDINSVIINRDHLLENLSQYKHLFLCDNHELVVTRAFNSSKLGFFRFIQNEDDRKKLGEPYVNEEVDSCPYCTEPLKVGKGCSQCGALPPDRTEIYVFLEPADEYGYQYEPLINEAKMHKVENGPSLVASMQRLVTLESKEPISFSELSFYFRQLEPQLYAKGFKFNKVTVRGPRILSLDMPAARWGYEIVRELDNISIPKLQNYIIKLKEEYAVVEQSVGLSEAYHPDFTYYQAALDYQFPKFKQQQPEIDEALAEAVKQLKLREEQEEEEDEQ